MLLLCSASPQPYTVLRILDPRSCAKKTPRVHGMFLECFFKQYCEMKL
jgi:hypothetical protein